MTSLRKLNRRLLRWTRYARRTPLKRWEIRRVTDSHWRAWSAVQRERSRRGLPNQWDSGPPKPWPGFDPMLCFEIVEPCDTCSGYGCAECEDDDSAQCGDAWCVKHTPDGTP